MSQLIVSTYVIVVHDPAEHALDVRMIRERVFSLMGEMHFEEGSLELDGFIQRS